MENNEDQIINLDIPVGIEFKFRDNAPLPAYSVFVLGYFGWLYNLAVTIDGMYYYLESGLTYNDISNGDYFMGVKLATGFNITFNFLLKSNTFYCFIWHSIYNSCTQLMI